MLFRSQGGAGNFSKDISAEVVVNEWVRVSLTFTAGATQTDQQFRFISDEQVEAYICGFQIEEGAFPTSYIPTDGATAIRNEESATIAKSAFTYNENAGTWYMHFDTNDVDNVTAKRIVSDGSSYRVMYNNAGSAAWYAWDGSNSTTYSAITAVDLNNPVKAAISEGDVGSASFHSGVAGSTTAAFDMLPNADTTIYLGSQDASNGYINGHLREIKFYPRRLSDAQLKTLTS